MKLGFKRKQKPIDDSERALFELKACDMVESIVNGNITWNQIKRATMLESDLLERILTRLAREGKIERMA